MKNRQNGASGNRQPSNGNGNGKLLRTTIFLPPVLEANLAVLALQMGESKSEVLREAIRDFLKANNLDPNKRPKVKIEY